MPLMGHLPGGARLYIQTERVQRWYNRMRDLHSGEYHELSRDMEVDEMLVFFIFCHHLKDWIIKETDIPKTEVENYVTNTLCLAICADIANGTKHMGVDDNGSRRHGPRSGEDFRMHEAVALTGENHDHVGGRIIILQDDGTEIDAFDIATQCMEKCFEFLTAHPPSKKMSN